MVGVKRAQAQHGGVVSKVPKYVLDKDQMSRDEVCRAVIKAHRKGSITGDLDAAYLELSKYVRQEWDRDRKSMSLERQRVRFFLDELPRLMSHFRDLHPQEFAMYELQRVELSRLCTMNYACYLKEEEAVEKDISRWGALNLRMEETHQLVKAALDAEATSRSIQALVATSAAYSCPHTDLDQEFRSLIDACRHAVKFATGECDLDAVVVHVEAPYPHSECEAHEALAEALERARVSADLLAKDCDDIRSISKYLCHNTWQLRDAENRTRADRFFSSFYKD
jgi:hypothetical protein